MEFSKSAFQTPITIKEVVESINRKAYLLPAIQREFVWSPEQIIKLFDSLMRDYTIGSFLFWRVSKEKIGEFQFYEFIRNFHERDKRHNPKANVTGQEGLTSILDGQQRLTTFYIGLKGSYAYKIPWKRWDNDEAFPERKLYLNLLSKSAEFGMMYDFRLLTLSESSVRDEKTFWFEVGKILEFGELYELNEFLIDSGLYEKTKETAKFANETLFKLWHVINEKTTIVHYLETSQDLDKVLNIFIRVNSGGTFLSYSDLLLSIATAQWKTKDAREEITDFVDDINRVGENFDFNKDFVLKSCLVLSDITDIAFKVGNFNISNMKKIESNWEKIKRAIRLSVDLISSFGYNYQTLTSANAVIPIAYYIIKQGIPKNFVQSSKFQDDRRKIEKWLRVSLIKRAFSGQPDNVLRPIRNIINENKNEFPYSKIVDRFKGTNKSFTFVSEDIENLIFSKYGRAHTFSVLSLLYPTLDYRNRFHIDHIFPRSFFTKSRLRKRGISESKIDFYMDNHDYLGNLQLLEGIPNVEKSDKDFKLWLQETHPGKENQRDYMQKYFIPETIDLGFGNFEEFFNERNRLILQKLKEILV